jgi:hypothetical protein
MTSTMRVSSTNTHHGHSKMITSAIMRPTPIRATCGHAPPAAPLGRAAPPAPQRRRALRTMAAAGPAYTYAEGK